MKEILIPPHEMDFTCGSYLQHGACLRLTGPQSCDISFLLTKLWNDGHSTKISCYVCDGTCLQQIILNHWIRQLSKLNMENLPCVTRGFAGCCKFLNIRILFRMPTLIYRAITWMYLFNLSHVFLSCFPSCTLFHFCY
jgi:hypothetical protein